MSTSEGEFPVGEPGLDTTLSDIADLIKQRRVEKTKELIASDEEDREAVDRFFYHSIGRKEKISDIDIVFQSPNYLLIRSELYEKIKGYNKPDYLHQQEHAVWVIGYDPDQESGFFIHELRTDKRTDDPCFEWTEEEIRKRMGFTREYQGGDLQPGETYRIQGDITITKEEDKRGNGIKYQKSGQITSEMQRIRESLEKRIVQQVKPQLEDKAEEVTVSTGFKPYRIRIDPSETDELKQLQQKLDIQENEIRDLQDTKNGWDVLTAKRRKQLIKEILSEPIEEEIADLIDEKEVRNTAETRVEENWSEREGQHNVQLGNHVLIFSNAIRDTRRRAIVRDRSKLFVIHDEHQNQELTLDRGLYEVNVLDRA